MKGLLNLGFLLLLGLQLFLGLALFYFRYWGVEWQLHEFSLKEESLMLSGHILSYFLLIFIPGHLLFFFKPSERDLGLILLACLFAFLSPLLGFLGSWFGLGVELIAMKAFGFFSFSSLWILISFRAFQKAMQVYYLRLNLQK